jgi:biotin transport system substrate-specific component
MNTKKTRQLILMTLLPAMMAATTGIYIPMVGANITLQTLFVLLSGFVLGSKAGALSMMLYLLLGVFGVPVFSGFQSGIGVLLGPSGGFIIAFPIAAAITGLRSDRIRSYFLLGFLATLTLYTIGIVWLMIQLSLPLLTVLALMAVYLPGDAIKLVVAVRLGRIINQRL